MMAVAHTCFDVDWMLKIVSGSTGAGVLPPVVPKHSTHTGAPWAPPPRFGAPVLISRDLMGGDRITVALVLAAVIGLASLFTRRYRRTREATLVWALVLLPLATLLLAWLASQVTPAFVSRYFAPILGAILLLVLPAGAFKAIGTVTFMNSGKPEKVVVELLRSGDDWRVADITWESGSLRALYRPKAIRDAESAPR